MDNTIESKTYRDRPINLEDDGTRKWIYAKKTKGKWYRRRTIVAWILLAFLVFAPWIRVNGHPFMLIDIAHRRFYLFGSAFFAQDTYILALIMVIVVVSIVLFTVAFGRLWCGWACPQTLFLEMVFRRIEYLFDGNYRKGKPKKVKTNLTILKHSVFFLTSVVFTNAFLIWFIGPEGFIVLITSPLQEHWLGFFIMLAVSVFYYWVYAFFREQVCTMICPYGRMQGGLLDSKSISVVYDYKRGEPRGQKQKGDCIDCKQCIAVCPTGIDIRNGGQLECVNCTACIDECNSVMVKMKKPENLIRYDSIQGIETGKHVLFNTRVIGYSIVLLLLFGVLVGFVTKKTETDTTLLRMPGTIYQQVDGNNLSNIYNAKILNKTNKLKKLELKLISPATGSIRVAGQEIEPKGGATFEGVVIIQLNASQLTGKSTDIEIGIYEGNALLETENINFIGPEK
jgi:cytochrome c oxidase accessory protein FixG